MPPTDVMRLFAREKQFSRLIVGIALSCPICVQGGSSVLNSLQSEGTELVWRRSYDHEGRVITTSDPGRPDCSFEYESHENGRIRLLRRRFTDGTMVSEEFDPQGQCVRVHYVAAEDDESLTYVRDPLGWVACAQWADGPRVELEYDTKGRTTSISVNGEFSIGHVYDFLGRLEQIRTPVGVITYEYQTGQGKMVRRLPNGIWTVWETAPDGKLTSITHVDRVNHILMKIAYAYRPDGLVREIREWTPHGEKVVRYDYDVVQRLVSVSDSENGNTEYGYDDFGNRTFRCVNGKQVESGACDWLGRLKMFNGRECIHDAAANLAACPAPNGEHRFDFNALGFLEKAVTPQGEVKYRYDGHGRLIGRTFATSITRFVPHPLGDVWRPLLAKEDAGEKSFYVWEGNVPLAVIRDGKPHYLLHDHLGSVRFVVDEEGGLLGCPSYDPFGVPLAPMPGESPWPAFAGLFYDPISKILITGGRSYAPSLGRFLQMDPEHRVPFGSQENLSPHTYCGSDPINRIDREGRASSWVWGPENAIWQALHSFLDFTYAKHYYAQQSEAAIASARGGLLGQLSAGLLATLSDVVGGGIPGNPANQGQAYAQVAWSIALSGWCAVSHLPTARVLSAMGVVRNIGSVAINVAEGGMLGALTSAISIGGTALSSGASQILSRALTLPSGQIQFSFMISANTLGCANQMQTAAQWIGVFGHYKNIPTVWNAGMKNWSSPSSQVSSVPSIQLPINVGGIYLRGAGRCLEGMGNLSGVALDQLNGRLILLSEDQDAIALPPLRLDDVVTVFRSVYEKGEAPFVSIDPNPDDPDGPVMLTRHGEMTRVSYVGWVMFEADRVMKAYSLGEDNLIRQPVQSAIEGYRSLLDSGFSDTDPSKKDKVWERFWIVPARVTRRESTKGELTLFDVPLRVMTQKMVLENGKLVPAPDDSPSPQARAFAEWFTENYNRIAEEAFSLPPEESGIGEPVSFFHELRRVALITAIAERLSEQGVEMPSWMKDYHVAPCRLAETTPAITVSKTATEIVQKKRWWGGTRSVPMQMSRRIYGGVNLAPEDSNVHTSTRDAEADYLAPQIQQAVAASPLFTTEAVQVDGRSYSVAALPGDGTQTLGAFVLREADLIVPIHENAALRLERTIHSFFRPQEEFGAGWTMDLPHMEKHRRQTRRTGDVVEYTTVFSMRSPLNTVRARFDRCRFVPEVNGELLVSDADPETLGLARGHDERIGFDTDEVIFRDGQRWHFDESGHMAARAQGPVAVIYRRNTHMDHRITRIVGWYGNAQRSHVCLEYDGKGRLREATGSDGQRVSYAFTPEGELATATGPTGEWSYEYRDGQLSQIRHDGSVVRTITTNHQGEVLKEWRRDVGEVRYQVRTDEKGHRVSTFAAGSDHPVEEMEYDLAFRPIRQFMGDGTQVLWSRNDDEKVNITVTNPGGDEISIVEQDGGRFKRLRLPGGAALDACLDDTDRIISMRLGGKTLLKQNWHHNGQPGTIEDESTAWRPEYRAHGTLSRVLVTPPSNAASFGQWLSHEADEQERLVRITDSSGLNETVGYDESGMLSSWSNNRGSVAVERDDQGRAFSMETSWGLKQKTTLDGARQPARTDITLNGNTASIEYEGGRPVQIHQFDGGETRVTYTESGTSSHATQVARIITPIHLELRYEYDPEGRVSAVICGSGFRVEYAYDDQGRLISLKKAPSKGVFSHAH